MTFGENLLRLRNAAKLTQRQLSKKCNIPHTSLSRYEQGDGLPTWYVACKLADGLGVSLQEFRR